MDLDKVQKIEKYIKAKWDMDSVPVFSERTLNPSEKKSYREELQAFYEKRRQNLREAKRVEERDGFRIVDYKADCQVTQTNICSHCDCYSLDSTDNYFLNKYGCCKTCYIRYEEGR